MTLYHSSHRIHRSLQIPGARTLAIEQHGAVFIFHTGNTNRFLIHRILFIHIIDGSCQAYVHLKEDLVCMARGRGFHWCQDMQKLSTVYIATRAGAIYLLQYIDDSDEMGGLTHYDKAHLFLRSIITTTALRCKQQSALQSEIYKTVAWMSGLRHHYQINYCC